MSDFNNSIIEMKLKIEAIESEFNKFNSVIQKLDQTIDTISNVSTQINTSVAVQNSKVEGHEKNLDHLSDAVIKS
ncbi:MAG TPA: hypothetical protein VIY47_08360, partial [Ignavibacteriaceae bacterium]